MTRIANLNTYKLKRIDRGTPGWSARVTTLDEISPDICGLQEVIVDENATPRERWDSEAAETIQDFAAACGLTAAVGATLAHPHGTAMAANFHRPWYTALLWNPDTVGLVSFRPYGAPDFWHGLTTAQFDVGAREPITVAVYHGDPFRPNFRADEALRIKGIFRRTGGVKPGFLIGDFNGLSAARLQRRWWQLRGQYYDPEPYLRQRHDDLEFQVRAGRIGRTFRRQLADRRQTQVLLRNDYMVDASAYLNTPWEPTVGHWDDGKGDPDPWGPRDIDKIFGTRPARPALLSTTIHRSATALEASDHLPKYADFDPRRIVTGQAGR